MGKFWTDKELKLLEDNYFKLGLNGLVILLPKRTKKAIQVKATRIKIASPRKKYTHNKNYFKTKKNNQSFIAGFIAADGCILTPKQRQKTLAFHLQTADKDILSYIKQELKFTGEIKEHINSIKLRICCANQIAKDLEKKYKITPRKTFTLEYPNLKTNKEHIKYIAGVFAGDGYANRDKRGYLHFSITSASKPFLDRLSEEVLRLIGYTGDKTYICKHDNCWVFQLTGKNAEAWIKLMLNADFPKVPERKWKKIECLA